MTRPGVVPRQDPSPTSSRGSRSGYRISRDTGIRCVGPCVTHESSVNNLLTSVTPDFPGPRLDPSGWEETVGQGRRVTGNGSKDDEPDVCSGGPGGRVPAPRPLPSPSLVIRPFSGDLSRDPFRSDPRGRGSWEWIRGPESFLTDCLVPGSPVSRRVQTRTTSRE